MKPPFPPPPPDTDSIRGGDAGPGPVRLPLPVYLLLAAILVAVVVHGLLNARPRCYIAWQERPSPLVTPLVEARR